MRPSGQDGQPSVEKASLIMSSAPACAAVTRVFTRSPRKKRSRASSTMSAMARRTSTAAAPTWGVRIAPRIRRRGWRTGRGSSGSVTSRAHRSRPERTSAVRASRSTIPPRATFTTVAPSGRRRSAARSRRPRVASVSPAARTRYSDSRRRRASVAGVPPLPRTAAAATYGSWTSRRGPKGRRRRAVSWPIRPKPRRPTVRPAQRLRPGALEVQPLVDAVRRAPQGLAVVVHAGARPSAGR